MRLLFLLAAGLYVANRLEVRAKSKREAKLAEDRSRAEEILVDETLDESFPASDPPSFSPPHQYHH